MGTVRGLAMTSSPYLLPQLPWGGEDRHSGPRVTPPSLLVPPGPGTSVMQVMASDADDPTYGSSARLVYSVLDGEHHFTVDPKTGEGQGQARGAGPGRTRRRGVRGRGQRAGQGLRTNPTAQRVRPEREACCLFQGCREGRAARQKERRAEGQKRIGLGAPARLAEKQRSRMRPHGAP